MRDGFLLLEVAKMVGGCGTIIILIELCNFFFFFFWSNGFDLIFLFFVVTQLTCGWILSWDGDCGVLECCLGMNMWNSLALSPSLSHHLSVLYVNLTDCLGGCIICVVENGLVRNLCSWIKKNGWYFVVLWLYWLYVYLLKNIIFVFLYYFLV